jgi:hypothetical protein
MILLPWKGTQLLEGGFYLLILYEPFYSLQSYSSLYAGM